MRTNRTAVATHIPGTVANPERFPRSTLAIAVSGALLSGVAVAQSNDIELETLRVEEEVTPDTNPYAEPGAPYLGKRSADPRRTRPLAETPQTITVLTGTQIEETGRSDLREILDGQPGITLGTGEGGNAFGDRYVIRGHEARSDMFVDGLRDPGMTIRESFAVEQIEITKGPSSSFAGRGSTGGAVNSVTKRAGTEYDFTKVSAGIGSDEHHRLTLDTNQVLDFDSAVRINLLTASEDVPNRDPADRDRLGVALSWTSLPSDQLEISTDLYHLGADDKPDLGTWIENLGGGRYGDPVADVPTYLQDEDFLESTVSTATLRIGYELSPDTRLVNLARYGTTDNGYLMTGARGTTAYPTLADAEAGTNGYDNAGLSTHQGWQEVQYFGNQLSLLANRRIGGLDHELVYGFEYTDQSVLNGVFEYEATGESNCWRVGWFRVPEPERWRRGPHGGYCLYGVDGRAAAGLNNVLKRQVRRGDSDSEWNVETIAASVMDTVDLNDQLTVFAGLRLDHYDYLTTANFDPDGFRGPLPSRPTDFADSDSFWNGHLGATWSFTPEANVYASYSTATNINGGESDVGTSCGYGGICVADDPSELGDPEQTRNLELGTKWNLRGGKLLATAAVFQITKSDVMESPSGDSYSVLGTLNTGKNRVQGIELGLSGNLSDKLSAQAGLALMDAEVLEAVDPDDVGKTLANFADNSASLHLKYQATPKFGFGGTMTYEGERYTGQPDTAANEAMAVPDYTVFDVFATYRFSRNLRMRLNVANVTDEDYYLAAYRSGSFTYIGDGRSIRFSLQADF